MGSIAVTKENAIFLKGRCPSRPRAFYRSLSSQTGAETQRESFFVYCVRRLSIATCWITDSSLDLAKQNPKNSLCPLMQPLTQKQERPREYLD